MGDLGRRIWDRAHLTGSFTLRSGAVSDEYFDKFLLESDPALLREICDGLAELVPHGTDVIAGVELGGVPIAAVLSQVTGLPALFVRKEAKSYGTRRLAEGGVVEGRRLVFVDDVVTTGGQIVQSVRELRDRGAKLDVVLCVVDRESGGAGNLAAEGLELRPLFRYSQIRP